mmetsp:Transcript_2468/g.7558  ORF Transcript_2468/g.7558 Transcript_2468/m.7558 type:complete len:206 (+) Transcript_2468:459-1076(+)
MDRIIKRRMSKTKKTRKKMKSPMQTKRMGARKSKNKQKKMLKKREKNLPPNDDSLIQTTRTRNKKWQISSFTMKAKNAKQRKSAREGRHIIVHNEREVELGTTKFVRLPTFSETFQTCKSCSPTESDQETKGTWVERVYHQICWKKKAKVNTKPTMRMWTILSSMTRKEEKDHPVKRRCVKFASSRNEPELPRPNLGRNLLSNRQ